MTEYPSAARQPANSRRLTSDQAAMLAVTMSVGAILSAMVVVSITVLPGEFAEPAPEPVPSAVGPTESASDEPEQALEYSTTEEADPDSREGVAALWAEALFNDDFATLEPLTCANPPSNIVDLLGYAEAKEPNDLDYISSNIFVTSRDYYGSIEVAIFLIAEDPTYDYIWEKESRPGDIITIMTVVEEDGGWKVCGVENFR